MRTLHLEPFENLLDKIVLRELDQVAIKSDVNSREPIELFHVGGFEFCLKSQNSAIY
jgi:hypothetical protein